MAFSFLRSWWPCTRPLTHLAITLYTRQGCHLCDDAWLLLQAEQRRHGFPLTAVAIDTEPQLVNLYGEKVPVVAVNGKVRFWGRINRVLLTRLLLAETRRQARGGV